MKRLLTFLVVVSFVMVPAIAFAQSGPEAGAARGQTGGQEAGSGGGETVYDFEDEDLTGGLMRPDGEQITGDQGRRTSSLINIRQDFIPEMLKSVETL
jgi:hypothetical protein